MHIFRTVLQLFNCLEEIVLFVFLLEMKEKHFINDIDSFGTMK